MSSDSRHLFTLVEQGFTYFIPIGDGFGLRVVLWHRNSPFAVEHLIGFGKHGVAYAAFGHVGKVARNAGKGFFDTYLALVVAYVGIFISGAHTQ